MHLSIGLHTSAGKSYPQPLQPAKHRGIALDINQRLRTDRPNYLSKLRSRESFFDSSGQKYPPAEGGKRSPYSPAPQVPQEATYIKRAPAIPSPQQQAFLQYHSHYLHRSKKRPLLVSKRTSTTHPIVPVLLTRVTSTSQLADQYWSHSPLNRSEAPSTNSRLYPIRIYMTRPALYQAITARGVYRKKGKEARP